MREILHYIATWGHWKNVIAFGSGFASGFTLKDLLTFLVRRHSVKKERRLDDAVLAYLIREFQCHQETLDQYGQDSTPYYRSTSEIADATKQKAVAVLQRLERLEKENRVLRCGGSRSDDWTATRHELHDHRP